MAEIIVVHGPPGSGKTSHCERLVLTPPDAHPVLHVSAGNRLRAIRTGEIDSAYRSRVAGPNVPALLDHEVMNGVIFEYIEQSPPEARVLVDGYPRFFDAVAVFMDSIKRGNHSLLGTINLEVSPQTSLARLSGRDQG